jgi:hypothetical protein
VSLERQASPRVKYGALIRDANSIRVHSLLKTKHLVCDDPFFFFFFFIQNVKRVIAVARLRVAPPTEAHAHNMHLIYRVTSTAEEIVIPSIKWKNITINKFVI